MTPNAGSLDRRVAYQEPATGPKDLYGQAPAGWTTVATVWAEVRTPNGRELVNASQVQAVVSHSLTVRRAQGWFPKPTGRFVYASPAYNASPREFNVVAAYDPDEGNTWVTCLCTERTTPSP